MFNQFLYHGEQVSEIARSHKKSENKVRKPSRDEYLSGFWKDDRLYPVITVVIYYGADYHVDLIAPASC